MESVPCWFDLLPWDSEFFGYRVARVKATVTAADVPSAQAELVDHNVSLAYWPVQPDD